MVTWRVRHLYAAARASALLAGIVACAHGAEFTAEQIQEILEQNRRLQEQVRSQQQTIQTLSSQMSEVLRASARHERELGELRERETEIVRSPSGNRDQEVRVSGEAGLAFFRTGKAGEFPNSEFRVDDAKLFIEAPLIKDTYFFGGLDLSLREINDEYVHLGELYIDFENVSRLWGQRNVMSVRAGRINIPFGTEYSRRGVVDNPLISHSLSDFWGIDEGMEAYGSIRGAHYILAVQNGGHPTLRDFNRDKAVTARIGFNPARWLTTTFSAMRTGRLDVADDGVSELWFGNAFFKSIGNPATTTTFNARLFEAEAHARWKGGHAIVTGGVARYDDDDTSADNSRHLRFFTLEGVQDFTSSLFAAVRYSEIRAPKGYLLAGWGNGGTFFYRSNAPLTTDLWRLSLGLGYRLGRPVVLKFEYTFEGGTTRNGMKRDDQDLLASELALRF